MSTHSLSNPLRVIALVDNDAFYASAERVRLGLSEGALWLTRFRDGALCVDLIVQTSPLWCSSGKLWCAEKTTNYSSETYSENLQIAVSYKAREYGIKRMETVCTFFPSQGGQANNLCRFQKQRRSARTLLPSTLLHIEKEKLSPHITRTQMFARTRCF
jgi:hypothetical protein